MKGEFDYPNCKLLLEGKRFNVVELKGETSQGAHYTRQIIDHPGAVVILPFLSETEILLIRNRREGVCETLLELPAGTREPQEDPLMTAKRELEEETGYRAKTFQPLLHFFSSPGICNERLYSFVASDLTFHAQNLDHGETIEVEEVSFAESIQLIHKGIIQDAKTICTLLYYFTQ